MIGDLGLFRLNEQHGRAEIGYVVAREHWGRGVATAAARAALEWSFETLRLHRVEAIVHPDNVGSVRMVEKLGFGREGTLREFTRIRGVQRDMTLYSLLAHERPRR